MREAVASQVTVPSEDLTTCGTVIGLDVRVREEVGLEVRTLIKASIANGALVRGLLHVEDLMDGQRA